MEVGTEFTSGGWDRVHDEYGVKNQLTLTGSISSAICLQPVCLQRPSQQYFSNVGTEQPLLGYQLVLLGVNVACSRTQHSAQSRDQIQNLF